MEADVKPPAVETLAPVAAGERIQALDVVRGFALIGIFLMNIEFFNRVMSGIGEGMPLGLTGLDWAASFFIAYFVQGKFWTIFSLLFGMGFAVMLTRAERVGRPFIAPYLRRILALAAFGAAHFIFIWGGDILFSYSVAAGALLILLYGKWKPILIALVLLVAIAFIPGLGPVGGIAGGLGYVWFLTLYLRSERKVKFLGRHVPLFGFILLVLGTIGAIAAIVLWALPNGPKDPRMPVTVISVVALVFGYLAAKHHDPVELRTLRLGVGAYVFSFVMMTTFGVIQYFTPPEPDDPAVKPAVAAAQSESKPAEKAVEKSTEVAGKTDKATPAEMVKADAKVDTKADGKSAGKEGDKKPEKTEAEKKAERKAERAKRLAEHLEDKRNEERIMSKGRYLEAVELRAREFPQKAAGDAGFASVLIGMFLIGVWFVRSGVMENTGAHLPLFRKLALYALPLGLGLGLLSALIAVNHIPGDNRDGFQMARGITMLGNLPACLGYVGLVVVMLHSNTIFAKISILAPAGRMALTNYLTQSIVSTYIFYGYGLGYWGLPRAWQVVYVAVFFALQIAFSHWWLARFRYGPMEWLWRGFTYRQVPAMRI